MISYVIYDPATGVIIDCIRTTVLDTVIESTPPGCRWFEGVADPALHRVQGGAIVDRPVADIEADQIAVAWSVLRSERVARLAATDWTQVPDAPVDRLAWAAYRQALRDLPGVVTDPRNVVWPQPPV